MEAAFIFNGDVHIDNVAGERIHKITDATSLVPFHPLCRCSVMAYIRHVLGPNPINDALLINTTPLSFRDISYPGEKFEFKRVSSDKIPNDLPDLLKTQILSFDEYIQKESYECGYVANIMTGDISDYISDDENNTINLARARLQVTSYDDNLMIATHSHIGLDPFNYEDFKALFVMMKQVPVKFMVVHTPEDIFIAEFKENAFENFNEIYNATKADYKNMVRRNMKYQSQRFGANTLWDNYLNNENLNKYISFRRISK